MQNELRKLKTLLTEAHIAWKNVDLKEYVTNLDANYPTISVSCKDSDIEFFVACEYNEYTEESSLNIYDTLTRTVIRKLTSDAAFAYITALAQDGYKMFNEGMLRSDIADSVSLIARIQEN